jgi:class 3 adenylate cyclase
MAEPAEERRAVLFADVCDSTSMYEAMGDAKALALINRLFKLLDKQVNTNSGITVKTLGDGLVCQFREADEAFRAACEMQLAATKLASDAKPALKIKVAYNYGPVVLKDRDVFGDTVNVCARLAALANPSQVLTTHATLAAMSPGPRGRCRELFDTKVRGRTGQLKVCEVLWRADPDVTKVDSTDVEPSAPRTWVLKLTIGGDNFEVHDDAVLRIGRDATNEVVVHTEHASRLHARIFNRDDHFVIADQSSNGTFLMIDGSTREVRLRRSEAVLGERGWIGLGKSTSKHGDHVVRYRLERAR